jgi:hypothetical protein
MEINQDKLEEVELLAYRYMSYDEIRLITELTPEQMQDEGVEKAILIGRLKRKSEFRGKLIALSDQLSSPAMNIEIKRAEETSLNDQLRK